MTCPACAAPLVAGQDRCPSCGAVVAPPLEGALAPDMQTPPARGKGEPLREIPGLRKKDRKEKTWKDEVRERVRHRKRERGGGEDLPLFPDAEAAVVDPPAPSAEPSTPGPPAPPSPEADAIEPDPYVITERMRLEKLDERVADLMIRPSEGFVEPEAPPPAPPAASPPAADEPEREWKLEAPPAATRDARAVERPAGAGERFRAAALDFLLLSGLWGTVVYFACRAARVPPAGLLPAWPYLVGYLAGLGLVYATYFTGTTGQTLGKMIGGLRVVDTAGRPPGYLVSLARAAVGAAGLALGFAGALPMFFDPARRALHDRLLKTRVIRA